MISERVYVFSVDGVMPAEARNSYVGRVYKDESAKADHNFVCTSISTLNRLTTVSKKATASAPLGLPAGRHEGSSVL